MVITEEILTLLCQQADMNLRLRQNYDLRDSSEDQSQRMLNAMQPGTIVPIHRHTQSSEVVTIIRGAIQENFYDEEGRNIESIILRQGASMPLLVVPKGVWHNLICLEPNTIIFECKNGAYEPLKEEDIQQQ